MINVTVDKSRALSFLKEVREDQIPFALANAINRTADEAQIAAKKGAHQQLHVRENRFLDFMFRQVERATKANPAATIAITGPKANILTRHEDGGSFSAPDPMQPFFIPSKELRPDPYATVPRGMYPKALRLMERRDVSGSLPAHGRMARKGAVQLQGKQHTFVIDARQTSTVWGVFQRVGSGKRDIRLLWFYVPRITIPPRLQYYATVYQTVQDRFDINFAGMMEAAMKTAR